LISGKVSEQEKNLCAKKKKEHLDRFQTRKPCSALFFLFFVVEITVVHFFLAISFFRISGKFFAKYTTL